MNSTLEYHFVSDEWNSSVLFPAVDPDGDFARLEKYPIPTKIKLRLQIPEQNPQNPNQPNYVFNILFSIVLKEHF